MTSPLDEYRKKATIKSQELRDVVEGEDNVKIKDQIYEALRKDPLFARNYDRPSLKQLRELNHRRWKRIVELSLPLDQYSDPQGYQCLMEVLETYDQGLSARLALHSSVFGMAVASMGTKRHDDILEKTRRNEIVGCFCLTELGHGSNTQEIQTTATFDSGEFVFNCPSEQAIKCWAGNLSHSATHAVVFAQLYIQGKCEGVHAFVLQVRDPATFEPLPGIVIGDMGEKPGAWNGVENGWMEFKNHRAPLWTLLNKGCEVTATGKYVSSYKTSAERQSVSLGALSIGRIGIIGKGVIASGLAATIAIRYSACRRQFGETKGDELPVIEYPLQQHRLFPYLAGHFAIRLFHKKLMEHFTNYIIRMMQNEKSDELMEFSKEIHALSAAAKPVSTWFGVEALGEARRACGGHGFLHSSRLNELRDSFDPSQTFEGENYMILQQTSNILLQKIRNPRTPTPMCTFDCLYDTPKLFSDFSSNIISDIIDAYKWLIHYYIKQTAADLAVEIDNRKKCPFSARNNVQVHRAQQLSIAYAELTIIDWSRQFVDEVEQLAIKKVLYRLVALYSLFSIEKHVATCYMGGYCTGPTFGETIRLGIRRLESEIYPDAIALVDAIAPPDFVLNSALGSSDGKPYEHLMREFRKHTNPRPNWWKDLSSFLEKNKSISSKL
nr:Acyl-CoA oxidase dehydrogenase and Acyl-CoA oxidase domain containing protein [Haemonchus contortus]